MASQRAADDDLRDESYVNDGNGIELGDIRPGIYNNLEHNDGDPHIYSDIPPIANTTNSGTNNEARKGGSNETATVTTSEINVNRTIYKVIVGLLLFCTLVCILSGVIVYHVINAKLPDNDRQVAAKTNTTDILAMGINSLKAEFSQFNDAWKKQMSNDNISDSRNNLTGVYERLEIMHNDYQAIERRLEVLNTVVQAVEEKQNSSGYFTETGGWELIFRATAGNGDNVYDAWTTGNDTTDVKPSSMTRGNSRHYRNTQNITEWRNVTMVKYSLFENGREVAFIIFNGTGSTNMDWFELNRVLDSSWSAIASRTGTYNHFSIAAYGTIRRFFVNIEFGGCPGDKGYIFVSDTSTMPRCPYEIYSVYPQFMYSIFDGPIYWHNLMYGKADYMAVFYRYN